MQAGDKGRGGEGKKSIKRSNFSRQEQKRWVVVSSLAYPWVSLTLSLEGRIVCDEDGGQLRLVRSRRSRRRRRVYHDLVSPPSLGFKGKVSRDGFFLEVHSIISICDDCYQRFKLSYC